jgi:single-stranded DNA-binding protein
MRYTETARPSPTSPSPPARWCPRSGSRAAPQGWKESLNGKNWELTTWFRVTCWRKLAEATNQFLEKGSQVFVEGELRGDASDGSQNPRVWTGNDGEHRASYEVTARTVKFLGKREGNGGAPIGEPPPQGYEDDDVCYSPGDAGKGVAVSAQGNGVSDSIFV